MKQVYSYQELGTRIERDKQMVVLDAFDIDESAEIWEALDEGGKPHAVG